MARILVVDDDPSLLHALRLGLRSGGHEVTTASNGQQGLAQSFLSSPDVMILDLGLPDIDGLTVCREIRRTSDLPIIVLSANVTEYRKVTALDEGADDYVTKPFGMRELEARIRAALRHRAPASPLGDGETLSVGALSIDRDRHEARLDGQMLELTSKEFDLLAFLAENGEKTCTHRMILSSVWGAPYLRETQYVHVYVNRLRHKLAGTSTVVIKTIPGVGYALVDEGG